MKLDERTACLERAFRYWRRHGFPYPVFSRALAADEFYRLRKINARHLNHVLRYPSMVGLRIVNSFHPQMWTARVRGRTPLECFNNDAIFRKSLERAIRFWPDRRCWNARSIRILCSIQNRSRVSNFRPTVARALIDALSTDGSQILDFSAGYGGRLLAAISLPRRYVGIDPAAAQGRGLRRMAAALGGEVQIITGCAEDVMASLPRRSFDLVFSSPPYFRLERYNDDESQSCEKFPRYDQWLRGFLTPIIEYSRRLLRVGGRLALNVSNWPRHPVATDTAMIAERIFGQPERVYNMKMSTNPADKARRGKLLRSEPIFIYRK